MKKLTAGIFATLLAVVSTGAANAEIASKGYVDDQVDTVEATVATKADKSALDTLSETVAGHTTQIAGKADKATTLAGYGITDGATKTELTQGLAGKVNNADITDMQVKANLTTTLSGTSTDTQYPSAKAVWDTIQTETEGIASSGDLQALGTRVTTAEGEIDTLQTQMTGKANTADLGDLATLDAVGSAQITDGAVATADIADKAVTEAKLSDTVNASLDKADTALQKTAADAAYAVKSTETVASTASTNARQALTDIGTKSELTTTNKDNLVGAINELDAAMDDMATNETIQGIQTDLTELEGKVDTNTTNIETNTTHIGTVGSLSTNTKTDLVSAVNEVKTQADKGVSDAAAAQGTADTAKSTADSALTKANAAIPAPTAACADSANKCVLVSAGAGNYSWEVIARGDAE